MIIDLSIGEVLLAGAVLGVVAVQVIGLVVLVIRELVGHG